MRRFEADLVVVGSGVCGLLAARPVLEAGRRVVMLERGGLKTHAQQLADRSWATDAPGARPNHEIAPGSPPYPWSYVYGVGGSTLHWTGNTPRFVESDLRMRSSYGVMVDWPISWHALEPFYPRAEEALAVAGDGAAQPPHPFSPGDLLVARALRPYVHLPQARPTRPVAGRPACCGSATCELCPVDSRFSPLNGLQHVLRHPGLDLHTYTAAARVRISRDGRDIEALEAVREDGTKLELRADDYVLAGGGFENAGILLRSSLALEATGRYLFDHAHRTLLVGLRRNAGAGRGSSLSTGASEAFRDGAFRARRSAAYVSVHNPGINLTDDVVRGLLSRRGGRNLRRRMSERWRRTLALDVLLEDRPRPERRVQLAKTRDAFGLPRLSVSYPGASSYERSGWRQVREDLERRLRPLGVTTVEERVGPAGSHQLGTCRMSDGDDGVVDAALRHRAAPSLRVLGGSAFPTYTPVHPTLTAAALAIRLGEELVDS